MKQLSLFIASMLMLFNYSTATAQQVECSGSLSIPALQEEIECLASANSSRCGNGLPRDLCTENNDRALRNGLVSRDAYDWLQSNGYCAVNIDGVHMIVAICPVGCFEEDTLILSLGEDGSEKWVPVKNVTKDVKLFGLNANALLSSPTLNGRAIKRMAYGPEETALFVFTMSNGSVLRVTQNHGMLLSDGRVIEARQVVEGDLFIDLKGSEVAVKSIARESTSADVYNFFLDVETPQEHILAAEGILVGDLAWQSTLASELNSISLRK